VLSRALCRFKLYRAAPGLSRAQIARAARTYAEAHAPFADTGMLVLRAKHGAEIWYWDKAQAGAVKSGPESLLREPGDGWRVLACGEGFEAQYWDDGGLIASTWRRQNFSQEQWAAFVLGVDAAKHEAPRMPPPPIDLPLLARAHWRARVIKPPWSWRDGETSAWSLALCALALAAFFAGQALHLEAITRSQAQAATAIEASIASDAALARARERTELLRAFNRVNAGGDALAAFADALSVFKTFNIEASTWRVDAQGLQATLNVSMTDIPLREVVAALEAKAHLCRVEPNLSSREGALELTAKLEGEAGACDRGGGRP
jgi:hypothetical protein